MGALLVEKIKEKIYTSNLTAAEVDRLAGIPQGTVRKILIGDTKNPGIETVSAISNALRCRINNFLKPQRFENDIEEDANDFEVVYPNLYKECLEFSCEFIIKNDIKITLRKLIDLTNEMYLYCAKKDEKEFDQSFAEWILEKKYPH